MPSPGSLKQDPVDNDYRGSLNVRGERHGFGEYLISKGDLAGDSYKGHFFNGKEHGYGVYTFSTGDRYEGMWCQGSKHGYGAYILAHGEKYQGMWCSNECHGFGVYTWPNGERYEGMFSDECFHGYGVYTLADGSKEMREYDTDVQVRSSTDLKAIQDLEAQFQTFRDAYPKASAFGALPDVFASGVPGPQPQARAILLPTNIASTGIHLPTVVTGAVPSTPLPDRVSTWDDTHVKQWLSKLCLIQYAPAFAKGGVNGLTLAKGLTDTDLDALNVNHIVHRKRIVAELQKLTRDELPTASISQIGDEDIPLPEDLRIWNRRHVSQWLRNNDFGQFACAFDKGFVTGEVLAAGISEDDLIHMKIHDRLHRRALLLTINAVRAQYGNGDYNRKRAKKQ